MNWFPLNREMTCRIGVLKRGGPVHLFVILITMITMITMMMMMMMMKKMMMMMMMVMMNWNKNGTEPPTHVYNGKLIDCHTYPPANWHIPSQWYFWRWFPFSNGGKWTRSRSAEGIWKAIVFQLEIHDNISNIQPVASTIPISLAPVELW